MGQKKLFNLKCYEEEGLIKKTLCFGCSNQKIEFIAFVITFQMAIDSN